MPRYVGLMVPDPESAGLAGASDEEGTTHGIDRYLEWQERLRAAGRLHAAAGLGEPSKVVRTRTGGLHITDGPFTEVAEVLAGYLVVEAADLDEAAALFAGHPATGPGAAIVVREITLTEDTSRAEHLAWIGRA
jgi:hypothetical protein